MVMDDPDLLAMNEEDEIGIFVPGSHVESEVNWDRLLNVLFLTIGGYIVTVIITTIMMFPMMAVGLIDLWSPEIFMPWSMLLLTLAEIGFIAAPVYYVRKHGLSMKSIGVRDMLSAKNMLLGVLTGILMIGGNLLISWMITDVFRVPISGDESILAAVDTFELIGWIVVMFVVVGFSEELVFRGFLQRRMEMYFKGKGGRAEIKALVITSFIFAAIHLDIIGLATRFMLGMFLGYLAQKTKYSMIGPTIAHGLNNAFVVVLATWLVWFP